MRNLDGEGTPEAEWEASPALAGLPAWRPSRPPSGRLVVVAPHPDDEILGCGGLIALASRAGACVDVIAVTDGEASHPDRAEELRRRRPLETLAAMTSLLESPVTYDRLGHPDGGVQGELLLAQLGERVGPGDLVVAPWRHDGHPDHDRVGHSAQRASEIARADFSAYLVWAWHWASPSRDLPWECAVRVELGEDIARRKRAAAACFASQLAGPAPILPPHVLARLVRSYEVYLNP